MSAHDEDQDSDRFGLNPTLRIAFSLRWNRRGEGLQQLLFDAADEPELVRFLCEYLLREPGSEIALDESAAAALEKHKIAGAASDFPRRVLLNARLPETLPELVPRASRSCVDAPACDRFVLNPRCWIEEGTAPPSVLAVRQVNRRFLSDADGPLLWVEDPWLRSVAVYNLDFSTGELLRSLKMGSLAAKDLPSDLLAVLRAAGILTPVSHEAQLPLATFAERVAAARAQLASHGFAVLRGLLTPLHSALCRAYFRRISAEGWLHPDPQVEGKKRYAAYRDPVCEHIHASCEPTVREILPGIKATYSFFGRYDGGAELKRHKDRPQCKWNLSLVVDADPELPERETWPLHIGSHQGPAAAHLNIGDAVLYSGTDLWHWREPQPEGHSTSAVFLHFVEADFDGSLD